MKEDVEVLLSLLGDLKKERTVWQSAWQDINDYILPNKTPISYDDSPGTQRSAQTIFDSTATRALTRLAATMNSLLTNPTSKWFDLITDDITLNSTVPAQQWFDTTSNALLRTLENSNFYSEINEMYIDYSGYGTGILYVEKSITSDRELTFSCRSPKECFIAENSEGIVDVLIREFKMTARQIVTDFDENISDKIKKAYDKNPEENFTIIHAVFPRDDFDVTKEDNVNMKFASMWIEGDSKHLLKTSGYNTFPYIVCRWLKESGEVYGRSPALSALPDIKTLNLMIESTLKAGQRIADPTLQVPDDGFSEVTGDPGEIVYYDSTMKARIEPMVVGSNFPIVFDMIKDKRDAISDAFYENQLLLIDRRELTAEEVRARQAENARILAPVFGLMNSEFLSPLIDRVMDILSEIPGILPETLPELVGQNYKLRFLSPLAKSQRLHEVNSILNTINVSVELSQVRPEILDNIDFDKSIRTVSDVYGSPGSVLRPVKDVIQIREVRAEQVRKQKEMEAMQQASEVAKTGTQAEKNLSTANINKEKLVTGE